MKSPKVTVLMSVYNGEKYLREAIDSILNQTFADFEFLIVNDSSMDGTAEILQSYHDSRIKIINNVENIGLTKSLNRGLLMARGDYIARQDADDVSTSDRLKKEIDFLEAHLDYAAVGTFMKILNDDSEVIRIQELPKEDAHIREFLPWDNCIAHGSVMIRKTCLLDIGLYDESLPRSQDYDLWLRLSENYRLANIPEYLYMWRQHNENVMVKYPVERKRCDEIVKANMRERAPTSFLVLIQNNIIDVEQATSMYANLIVEKNISLTQKPLTVAFHILGRVTFKRITLSKLYKALARIRFSRRINTILRDTQVEKISFEKAELSLKDIINRRLI